ncbi:MAG: hypothetical protein IT578_03595 [Verrucomicrobiae bacterium]|nr:hypothetical protein [Verrucomicrobiae bacterium]
MACLRTEILWRLRRGAAAWTPATRRRIEARLHAEQARENPVYRAWLQANGSGKRPVALPVAAWREARVFTGRGKPGARFVSSGTTSVARGRHDFRDLAVYEASVVAGWAWAASERARLERVPPKTGGSQACPQFFAIMAPPSEAPHSSLSRMLEILMLRFGGGRGFWALRRGKWDWAGLSRRLGDLRKKERNAVVFGTAFGWVRFLDACAARRTHFSLGQHALAFETGGTKGRSREVSREELHGLISGTLGIPHGNTRSEYSMCELSSQAWSFGDALRFPPWCLARVAPFLDSGTHLPNGVGVLEIHDLANTDSCAFVRTEDLAVAVGGGFALAGRAPRATLKGCSLAHEGGAG